MVFLWSGVVKPRAEWLSLTTEAMIADVQDGNVINSGSPPSQNRER